MRKLNKATFEHIETVSKHFGVVSIFVIIITFVLFVVALFVTGFTHDLLLEIAVFLVSVKLILMTYSNSVNAKRLERKINRIEKKLDRLLYKNS